ncbi:MAG: hypothetical protein ACYTG6_08240 [Planctomycetota bacterium]|jgi:hypothetical protein
MGRKATDLLDVFRQASGEPSTGGREPRRGASRPKKAPKQRRRFEGVFLAPRQVLLGSAVLLLLVVLSFTVGVGFGRSGGGGDAAPALSRTTQWYIRGSLKEVDAIRGTVVDPAEVAEDLADMHQVPRERVSVRTKPDGGVFVFVGPFASEAQARRYFGEMALGPARVRGGVPFRRAEYISVPPR